MENTEVKVRQIVASVTGLPPDADPNANLYLDLGVASVHALGLLTELENQFGVSIPDDDFVAAISIAGLSSLMADLTRTLPRP